MAHDAWKFNYANLEDIEDEEMSKLVVCPDCKGKKYLALFSSLTKCTLCLATGRISVEETHNID